VAAESAMTGVQNLISDTRALCVQMVSANTTPEHRQSAAQDVSNTLIEMLSLANTEVNGRYIFAGSKTESPAFDQNGIYRGDAEPFKIKISKESTIEVGGDGEALFQPTGQGTSDDIFQTMSDLKTALLNNNISGVQEAMTELESQFEHVTNKISSIGSRTIRMEVKERIFEDLKLVDTERLSMIEDADLAAAVIDLKEIEVAYQAAMNSSGKVMQLSLVDYL
jgi:flagellar hook-associated protein 3 FlgL